MPTDAAECGCGKGDVTDVPRECSGTMLVERTVTGDGGNDAYTSAYVGSGAVTG